MEASKKAYDDICEVRVPLAILSRHASMLSCYTVAYSTVSCCVCKHTRVRVQMCVCLAVCPQEVLESEDIAAAVLYALAAPARVDVSCVWRSDCSCARVCVCVCCVLLLGILFPPQRTHMHV